MFKLASKNTVLFIKWQEEQKYC